LRDSVLSVENHGGAVIVRDRPFGKDNLSDSEDHFNPKMEVQIHVPAGLEASIEIDAGSADSSGSYRSFAANVAAGDLAADSVKSDTPISLHVGAGKVVDTLPADSHFDSKIDIGAGDAQVVLPSGADAEISATVSMGRISGLPASDRQSDGRVGDSRRGRAGSGDSRIDVHVGMGSIKVNSSDSLNAVADDYRVDSSLLAQDLSGPDKDSSSDALKHDSDAQGSDDKDADLQLDGKDLSKIGDVVSKALGTIQPQLKEALDKANSAVSESLMDITPQVLQALDDARPEIEKAMADAKRADKHLTARQREDIRKALREANVEVRRAMAEARSAVDKAMKDLKTEQVTADRVQIEAAVRDAMKAAREAMKEAEAALKDAEKKGEN
jgi:hypothetical protein